MAARVARECAAPRGIEAYLANLSNDKLIITALLPSDAESYRNLMVGVRERNDLQRGDALFPLQGMTRERVLHPGDLAQFSLRIPTPRPHVSLFRLRKEREAASCFLKYAVEQTGGAPSASLTQLGTQDQAARLENTLPHLLCVW